MSTTSMSIRVDNDIKEKAKKVFNALGLDMYDHDDPQASYNKRFGRAVRYVNQTWHTDLATQRRGNPRRLLWLPALIRRVLFILRP